MLTCARVTLQFLWSSYLQCESQLALLDPGPPLRLTWSVWSSGVWTGSMEGCLQDRGHCSPLHSSPPVGLDPCVCPCALPSPTFGRGLKNRVPNRLFQWEGVQKRSRTHAMDTERAFRLCRSIQDHLTTTRYIYICIYIVMITCRLVPFSCRRVIFQKGKENIIKKGTIVKLV